jgi:hypothetical protein
MGSGGVGFVVNPLAVLLALVVLAGLAWFF